MTMNNYSPGDRFVNKGVEYEIAHVSPSNIRFNNVRAGNFINKSPSDFDKYIKSHNIKLKPSTSQGGAFSVRSLTEKQKQVLQQRYDYVNTLLQSQFHYSSRNPQGPQRIINEVANRRNELAPAFSTVCKWVKKFIEMDRDKFSLVPHPYRSAKSSTFEYWIEKEISHLADAAYTQKSRRTVIDIAYQLHRNLEEELIVREEHGLVNLPSIRTLQRRVRYVDPMYVLKQSMGRRDAEKALKPAGKSFVPSRVFEHVEADGNYVDIIVVDDDGMAIGRPYLTVFIDRFSRHILSYELSMFAFSAYTLLRAAKGALNDDNGLPGGLIETLVIDNGADYTSTAFKSVCSDAGVSIEYAAPGRPDAKPFVERFFRTLNINLIHKLPGTTYSNVKQRGNYDSKKDASLTLDALREAIGEELEIYHSRKHRGLSDSPARVMERMLTRRPVASIPQERLEQIARLTKERIINKGRIQFEGLYWYSARLRTLELQLKDRRSNKKERKVKVYIDELDLGEITVEDPLNPGVYITADAYRDFQKGLSLFEYREISDQKPNDDDTSSEIMSEDNARKKREDLAEKFNKSPKQSDKRKKQKLQEVNNNKKTTTKQGQRVSSATTAPKQNPPRTKKPRSVDMYRVTLSRGKSS